MRVRCMLIALLFVAMLAISGYADIAPESVLGVWLFDEGKGDTAKDSSGNGNDGEIQGDVNWVDEGRWGKALEFPGVDENFVEVPHNDSLDLITFSFTVWVKIVPTGSFQAVLIKTADCQLENYSGYIFSGTNVFWTRFTSGGPTQWGFQQWGPTVAADDEWHHLAGTYDMESVKSYIDGVVDAEAPFNGEPDFSPGPLNIGDCPGFAYPVKGIMDEVGLFNVALTEDEIKDIMDNGLSTAIAVSPVSKIATTWGRLKSCY